MKKFVVVFAALSGLLACFSTSVSPGLVRVKAAADLSCPQKELEVSQITDGNWYRKGVWDKGFLHV